MRKTARKTAYVLAICLIYALSMVAEAAPKKRPRKPTKWIKEGEIDRVDVSLINGNGTLNLDQMGGSGFNLSDLRNKSAKPPTFGAGANGKGSSSGNGGSGKDSSGGTEFSSGDKSNQSNGGGGGDNLKPGSGGDQAREGAIAHPLWYPMCLFIDPEAVSESAANATVRGMIEEASTECQVNLVIFPVTIKPSSYNKGASDYGSIAAAVEELNNNQKRACNMITAGLDNATRASTSTCVDHDQFSDAMCKQDEDIPPPGSGKRWKKETAGCATVNSSPGEAAQVKNKIEQELARLRELDKQNGTNLAEEREKELKSHNFSAGGGGLPIAESIEDKRACTQGIVNHEAIGHSQFGHPNGSGDGNGIGFQKGGADGRWTPEGCAAMRRNAFSNSGRWKYDPQKTTYYVQPKNPDNWYDLRSDPPLFKSPNDAPPGGPSIVEAPKIIRGKPADRVEVMDGDFFDKKAQKPAAAKASPPPAQVEIEDGNVRHKKRAKPSQESLLASAKDEGESPEDSVKPAHPKPAPPETGKPASISRVDYDESMPKGSTAKSQMGSSKGKVSAAGPPLGEPTSSTYGSNYTDSQSIETKSATPMSMGSSISSPMGKSSIGYDESMPKGAASVGLSSSSEIEIDERNLRKKRIQSQKRTPAYNLRKPGGRGVGNLYGESP